MLVWESTWSEYQLQVQNYDKDKRFTLFSELLHQVPAAEKLHFLVSASVTGYLRQLNGKVPDILNNLGIHFLPFRQYQFEIIESGYIEDLYPRSNISTSDFIRSVEFDRLLSKVNGFLDAEYISITHPTLVVRLYV